MTPLIYPLIYASADCKTYLGDPPRFDPFGDAPQGVPATYATWQLIGGAPLNYLRCNPDADTFNVQIDVFGADQDGVRNAAKAIRDAIQENATITSWRGEMREPSTKLYRYSFDALFFTKR